MDLVMDELSDRYALNILNHVALLLWVTIWIVAEPVRSLIKLMAFDTLQQCRALNPLSHLPNKAISP